MTLKLHINSYIMLHRNGNINIVTTTIRLFVEAVKFYVLGCFCALVILVLQQVELKIILVYLKSRKIFTELRREHWTDWTGFAVVEQNVLLVEWNEEKSVERKESVDFLWLFRAEEHKNECESHEIFFWNSAWNRWKMSDVITNCHTAMDQIIQFNYYWRK